MSGVNVAGEQFATYKSNGYNTLIAVLQFLAKDLM